LNDAVCIHVGVFAAGYTIQGLGFDLGRGTPGISVTVLAQVILNVILVTGGRYYSSIWQGRYLPHVQYSGLRERYKSNESWLISVIKLT
jgi:Ethanolamine utilization protein EutJ (predicted chaperonin)